MAKHKLKKIHDRFLEKMEKDVKELGKHKSKKKKHHHVKHEEHHKIHTEHKKHHEKVEHHKVHHVKHHTKHHKIEHKKQPVHHLTHQVHHEHKPEHMNHVEHKKEHHIKHKKHYKKHRTKHHEQKHLEEREHYIEPVKIKSKKKQKPKFKKANIPTLNIKDEKDIAMDFATKVYQRFNKLIKSVVLFGSTTKQSNIPGSDIDIIIILDDATIKWDKELIEWYRGELEKIVKANPYSLELHINTIKLTTWWDDLMRGDPVVINVIRDGETLIDFGGFFEPLKYLLVNGKIKATPESVYSLLQRAPMHLLRSKASEIGAIEGIFWSMVDSSQAALISIGIQPPSPEHIPAELKINFVNSGKLKMKYVMWYRDLFMLHKKIVHREISDLKGVEIDDWQQRANEFLQVMAKLVDEAVSG